MRLYDKNLEAYGPLLNVRVPLNTFTDSVMSIELEGALSTASMIQFVYDHVNILCMEKLQVESLDKTTQFNIIQVT